MKFETIEAYSLVIVERIEPITKYLVSILSVNGIEGEVKLADNYNLLQHRILKLTQKTSCSKF